jgi:hypothetical protein
MLSSALWILAACAAYGVLEIVGQKTHRTSRAWVRKHLAPPSGA